MTTRWTFRTDKLSVVLETTRLHGYKYDGDDDNGSIQLALDAGHYVAFDSIVRVLLDGEEIGWDHLGSSVYSADQVAEFWTSHRDPNPMNRNCSAFRAVNPNTFICHYFPGMVRQACQMAREELRARVEGMPKVRAA